MAESAKCKTDVPLESSIPHDGVPLESLLLTEELRRRPTRPPEYEKENRALVALAGALAESPRTTLQTLAEMILEVTQSDSSGVSLLTSDGTRFYWPALAGRWRSHIGKGTPRNFGPCGDVLDRNMPLLMRHWERRYTYFAPISPPVEEGLLVPFYVGGKAVGAIWVVMHDDRRKFDAEDERLLTGLGKFASMAYQALASIDELRSQIGERERAEAVVRELAKGLEKEVRLRTEELEQRNKQLAEATARLTQEKLSLERSEAYLEEAQRLSRTGSWHLNVSTGEVFWSQECFAIFGFDATETKPSYAVSLERIHPEDRARVEQLRRLSIRQRKDFEVEYRILRPDGSIRYARNIAHCLASPSGDIEYVGALMDITERKRAEEALRKSEVKLRQVIDAIPTLAWCNLPDGPNEFLNKGWHEYTGLLPEDSHGWGWQAAFHPEDLPTVMERWRGMLVSGEPGEIEARLRRYDGAYRWFLIRAGPLRDETGKIVRWYGTSTDIDDRKRAEEKLRRSEAFLAEGQQLARIGTFCWRVASDEILWSEQLYRIFEFDQGGPVTLDLIASRVHPEDLNLVDDMVAKARAGASDFEYEHRLLMPDRSIKYLHLIAHGSRDTEGRLEYTGAVQDVTQRRASEEALAKARSEFAYVARVTTLGTLTASIAHEVNQPLSGIIMNASTCLRMLAADPPNVDGARETARRTIRDGNRAADVIARLRALFGRKDAALEAVDMNDAAREVIALLRNDFQRYSVIFRPELTDNMPPVTGDRIQLQQVILNLLRNAMDAMSAVEDRPRELVIRTERGEGDQVRLSVRDAGVGLDPQAVDKLFDAFYTTKNDGMGIGLSVSRSIVESHRGRLWATPNEGPGATFSFSIPCVSNGLTGARARSDDSTPRSGR